MSNAIVSGLISFGLVTVIGSLIVYSLQQRNWIRQQQVSAHEKKIADLRAIFVDLDATFSKRLYWTRRLLYALRRYSEERLSHAVAEYDKAITEWNEKRNSFQIRLAAVVGVSAWQTFEHSIATDFTNIGGELETFARRARRDKAAPADIIRLNELEYELNDLSRSTYEFSREIYRSVQSEEESFYSLVRSKRLPRNMDELSLVSTWFLLASLFVPPPQSLKKL